MNARRRTYRSENSAARRGIATLELVLSLPFLFVVAVSTMALGWAILNRAGVAIDARRAVWKDRLDLTAVDPGHALHPLSMIGVLEPESGEIFENASKPVSLPTWLGGANTAHSGNAVLTGTWDYREVPGFEGSGFHYKVLAQMAAETGIPGFNPSILSDLNSLLAPSLGSAFTQAAQNAVDKFNAAKKSVADKLAEAQKVLDALKKTLDAVKQLLSAAEDLADSFHIVPKWLRNKIDGLKHEIDDLENKIQTLEDEMRKASDFLNNFP